MISLTELQYITSWASKTPYPGLEYSKEVFERLISAYKTYNDHYKNKKYEIHFSNGEQIFFEIQPKNLCHMVGVDYKNLSNEYFDDFRDSVLGIGPDEPLTSYDLLTALIDHKGDVLQYDCDTNGKVLNYYRIRMKCDIFSKISDFSKFDFGCILFDLDTYEKNSGKKTSATSSKLFYLPSEEALCPYFMMGLTKSEGENNHFVQTLLAPTNPKDFFNNQVVAIPTQIIVADDDAMHKYLASPSEKLQLLNSYKQIIQQYAIPNKLDIFGDYTATLAEQHRQNEWAKKLIK